jgi:hypothetical protein
MFPSDVGCEGFNIHFNKDMNNVSVTFFFSCHA